MNPLPQYISIVFGMTTILTLLFFYLALKNASTLSTQKLALKITLSLVIWLIFQAVLTLKQVYSLGTDSLPPKIVLLGVLPMLLCILTVFFTQKGRQFADSLPLLNLTYLHVVRIPVELVLYWLFLNKMVPELMTFAGRNFDILAGISAPLMAYFGIGQKKLSPSIILIWNFICIGLLFNIVINALFSVPGPLQKQAFDQPNIAILHFPFSWLATFVVPVVLFAHISSVRQLLIRKAA